MIRDTRGSDRAKTVEARPDPTRILLLAVAAEIAIFSAIAPHFATAGNFFEVTRLSVELGLLAVAITPILVSGGIDLSVGAMMGLAAVVLARPTATGDSVGAGRVLQPAGGCAGGAPNALLIARLNIPALIVTLGTFSLFRGIAEGITRGAVNYSGFPASFLQLGQGYLWNVVPAQLPLFLIIFAGYAILLHRSVLGRALYAIGFGAAGARYAGIPVARRVGLIYVLSGLMSSVAAIVYVAHLGQAKSDAGIGYELDAITAVVLGGTSVFGGRGTLWGTLLAFSRWRYSGMDCGWRRFLRARGHPDRCSPPRNDCSGPLADAPSRRPDAIFLQSGGRG
jgi:rhamnose transport system permease protein